MFQKFVGFAMIAATLLVGSASAATAERLEAIRQAIFAMHPDSNFRDIEFAEGDLDGDGVADVAYLAHLDSNKVVLGVLRGQTNQKLARWQESKPFANAHHGTELSIEKRSIFVSGFNSGTGSENWGANWSDQFQFRRGEFLLIGSESSEYSPLHEDEGTPIQNESVSTSTNYLTRKVITTTIKNKNKTVKTETLPADRKLTRLRDYGDL
jgi:hypothetical protein